MSGGGTVAQNPFVDFLTRERFSNSILASRMGLRTGVRSQAWALRKPENTRFTRHSRTMCLTPQLHFCHTGERGADFNRPAVVRSAITQLQCISPTPPSLPPSLPPHFDSRVKSELLRRQEKSVGTRSKRMRGLRRLANGCEGEVSL